MFTAVDFDASDVELPPARKRNREGQARHLDEGELAEIFNLLPCEKWQCIFAIAYFTGSRIGEVLKLRVEDIDGDRIIFRKANTKTRSHRAVAVVPQLQTFLAAYEAPSSGYMFPSRHNAKQPGHIQRRSADQVLRVVCEALDLDGTSTHSFRRSFATNLHKRGRSLAEIQRLLGHRRMDMTARYVG